MTLVAGSKQVSPLGPVRHGENYVRLQALHSIQLRARIRRTVAGRGAVWQAGGGGWGQALKDSTVSNVIPEAKVDTS